MQKSDSELALRLQRLEDIESIRQLKARYCAGCDDDHNPETLTTLFAVDAVWEATGIARAQGHTEITAFFQSMRDSGRIRRSAHHAMNPDIDVNGDTATGHWRLIMLYTSNDADETQRYQRIIGSYTERYIKRDGHWLFAHLYCEVEESGPYLATSALII
jgi:hypothetical protein